MPEEKDFATWIVNTRTLKGWSIKDLAEHSGLSSNAIWQYENSKRSHRPDPKALAKIAIALDYPPEVLWKMAGFPLDDASNQANELTGHVIHLMNKLSPESQTTVASFVEYLVNKQEREMKNPKA